MADLDIRKPPENEKIDRIIFGDDNRDGLGKACYLKAAYPHQCDIVARDGTNIHIKFDDVDYLIAGLRKARELWGRK